MIVRAATRCCDARTAVGRDYLRLAGSERDLIYLIEVMDNSGNDKI